jgi:hypothetical protein
MRRWLWLLASLGGMAIAETEAEERVLSLELPVGHEGLDAVRRAMLDVATRVCGVHPGREVYIDRLYFGPIQGAVEDGLHLAFRCLSADDARLSEPGRHGGEPDAGNGVIERRTEVSATGPFGWDMTYGAAFDAVGVPRNDTMRKLFRDAWLKAPYVKSLPDPHLFELLDVAEVAVLIDYELRMAVYGGRKVIVVTANEQGAQIRATERRNRTQIYATRYAAVRSLASVLLEFQPSPPADRPRPHEPDGIRPGVFVDSGYAGVVSVNLDGRSRQVAISREDLERLGPMLQRLFSQATPLH